MHFRKAAPSLVLAALLSMTGCVSVHHPARPPAPGRPAGIAPAADRPPSPLPTWPEPRQAPPREALGSTGPGAKPKKTPATARPWRGTAPPARTRPPIPRRTERYGVSPPKTDTPRAGRTTPKLRPPQRQRPPQMAQLCGQADGVVAPGLVKLCRDAYGR
ncbi:hypothetical protein ACF06X_27450 [Streptomyces sp. NPDC015346]|uniref:hypothetical protein n=1 Tax=Streptomyces sp. NPDC015346 TaxID=3364954 RepID=UPI00370337E7